MSRSPKLFFVLMLLWLLATGSKALHATPAEPGSAPGATKTPPPKTTREFYNAGTERLEAGDLREAETMLETVLGAQDEQWQSPALYNLGHVRYAEGAEALKKAPPGQGVAAASRSTSDRTGKAISQADEALATEELQKLVAAYQNGRGRRKEAKAVLAAIKDALKQHELTLNKWQRASGDFKSAAELTPTDHDAKSNADLVDRHIAKLVDMIQQMQQMAAMLGQQSQQLGEKLKQLKGKIPADQMPPGAAGDDDEDEDQPFGKNPGQKEGESREGKEMNLSPEQAGWLLEAFKLDSERRLPMGMGKEGKPRDPNKPTW